MSLNVCIKTIPAEVGHRCGYATAGDWWYDEEGVLQIRVTELGDRRSEAAIAMHEWAEAEHCRLANVSDAQICQFDTQFESERATGLHSATEEPGDDPRAPYRESHWRAIHVERALCHALDLPWDEHNGNVESFTL
jgi:hypothetical protein